VWHPPPRTHPSACTGPWRPVSGRSPRCFPRSRHVLGLPLGYLGALGSLAYFLGRAAVNTSAAEGAVGGRGMAVTGWVVGAVAMAIGSAVTLVCWWWLSPSLNPQRLDASAWRPSPTRSRGRRRAHEWLTRS